MSTTLESPKTLDLALQLDADQRTSWLAHLFRPFSNEGMEDLLDWRFLGISTLKSSTFGIDEVSFFELSEPWKKQQDQPAKDESSTPSIATNSEDSLVMGSGQSTTTTRVRNTTAEHSNRTVVMSLDTQVFKPSKRQVYYLFPSDAIVEKMSETPPYELFCSFHALDALQKQQGIGMAEHPSGSSLDRQQCYTDFPSSPLLSDTTTPDVKMQHSVIKASLLTTHLSLSGISKELYLILKDSVSRFEVAYEKMVQLMKLHTQGLSHRCAELLLTDSHLVQPKKPKSELKISKGKRKGSYQQRLISPRTPLAIAPATPFVSSTCLSSKAKSIPSTPKRPSFSPPMATTTVSTPITPSAPPPPPPLPSTASSTSSPRQSSTLGRKCFYCGSKTTPMWRRGPDGAGTLCNACGVKWKHGKILCGQPIDGTPDQQKKRKQQVKLKKDKRIKMQQQKQHGSTQVEEDLQSNDDDEEEEDDDDEDNFSYEEDNDDDDEEEEQMKHNIVAARHLTIHESPYTSASLDDSTAAYHQYDNGQHPYYEQRPRRHTADVSVLERGGPWVDYPLSMGVDAVEAATVLTLLKRSSQT